MIQPSICIFKAGDYYKVKEAIYTLETEFAKLQTESPHPIECTCQIFVRDKTYATELLGIIQRKYKRKHVYNGWIKYTPSIVPHMVMWLTVLGKENNMHKYLILQQKRRAAPDTVEKKHKNKYISTKKEVKKEINKFFLKEYKKLSSF